MDNETKELLLQIIENLAGLENEVGNLSASVSAFRLTLSELGAEFEERYAKHYAEPTVSEVLRRSEISRDLLLTLARTLRGQA